MTTETPRPADANPPLPPVPPEAADDQGILSSPPGIVVADDADLPARMDRLADVAADRPDDDYPELGGVPLPGIRVRTVDPSPRTAFEVDIPDAGGPLEASLNAHDIRIGWGRSGPDIYLPRSPEAVDAAILLLGSVRSRLDLEAGS